MAVFLKPVKKMTSFRVILLVATICMLAIDLMNKIPSGQINWNDFSTYSTDLGLLVLIAVLGISLLLTKIKEKRKKASD